MSLQSNSVKPTEIPLSEIRRPLAPVLDPQKIDAMVATMKGIPTASKTCSLEQAEAAASAGELPPVDVLGVRVKGQTLYYAFGGCHRLQAYDRRARETQNAAFPVRCRVLPATPRQIRMYLGSSLDIE
ncbi:ADI_G0037090.mRNA.1.CDS.1 [Saccharomyces cerevisiae]|uniref:Sulfiredoxin n=9 Tax=Saccharomyces TaxID=4930 RepID=SRX1_YEAST|nr:sulfiredoxin [Saccharomyces cerevisiae S288C]P36077.1 RecName: Full=Sulfiredoxin; AltName: Full=Sulphiredoxin [Saccharomyces cerevisiae S288C]AAS56676.1 YKL086W [Saccharomyces cerevisiae]AHY76158.1 Srx1p [Saccharomyces cerevisiae YJM993]AJS30150.1 Srx1p [Saccharomyces cerevisiae YJM189]AJS31050.1 Srx1p [Saccharomyces cerevisiae YJM244]AJS31346.1 Srx1p [Saccharomyces cerevisiae YJM248]AJS31648.1 Srx1p [Saccharomyces cerevisiae YJM270]AJS31947.1 Srx1p [Saccharomyces cerevisiae YJM271]AJS3|eukprot:NP_012837.1 sulfiredoxin [Saccharomyces cerevisiae S288C]